MTYSSVAILALLVHIIIHFDVFRNTHYHNETPEGIAYRQLIFSIASFYVFDALWGILYNANLVFLVFADTEFYFAAMAAILFCWIRFVIRYLLNNSRLISLLSLFSWLTLSFFGIVLILNLFVPVMFWFDEEGLYHAGVLRYVTLFIQIVLFFISGLYFLLNSKMQETKAKTHHMAIAIFGISMAIMVGLQVLYPLQPLYAVSCLLGACILHTFVVNDMKEDRRLELEEMVIREHEQEEELGSVKKMAYTDSLTGVKSSHAYVETEKNVDQQIANDQIHEFGVIVFDLNGLKKINDTKGHDAGDHYIQDASRMICRQFKHSPVFRIGGDEFVVFLEGEDYINRKKLLEEFDDQIELNLRSRNVVVATGMAVFRRGHDNSFRRVFERADQRMYDRKGVLKAMDES